MTPTKIDGRHCITENGVIYEGVTLARNQPEYLQLPVFRRAQDPSGVLTSRWRLTWRERFRVFISGVVFVQVMTFCEPMQPIKPSIEKPNV